MLAQTFELLNTQNLKGGYLGFGSFVDYNNDGYLDIFVTGQDFDNGFSNAVFYENNADLSFTESPISNIPRVIYGDYSWADFDKNGTLDLLYSGTTSGFPEYGITKVFRNVDNGCEFVEIPVSLAGTSNGTSHWVDIDNDGFLDIFLTGNNVNNETEVIIYKNQGGDNFVRQVITTIDALPGGRGNFTKSTARWDDLNGDGLEDLVIARSTELAFSFDLYMNLGGFQFSQQNIGLPKLSYVAMEIGDINNDNRLDIVFTGSPNLENLSGDGTGDLYVFTNDGNMNFTNSFTIADEGVFFNDIELGDIDNDGFLDVINYGTGPWGTHPEVTKIYKNNRNGTFSNFSHALPDCRFGGVEFGDFDNDNDLDVLYFGRIEDPSDNEITYIYENTLLDKELPTEIVAKETCVCDNTLSFTLDDNSDLLLWEFGDPTTGVLNTSTEKKASHTYSNEGSYTVSATYTKGSTTNIVTKVIHISGLPTISQPEDLASCTNGTNDQYDFHALKDAEILNGASTDDFEIFYYTSYVNAAENRYRISMPYTNQNTTEIIYARLQRITNPKCFLITDFQITIEDPPVANPVGNIMVCDDDNNGFAIFDLTSIESIIIGGQSNMAVEYYSSQGTIIPTGSLNTYQNTKANIEIITARIIDTRTNCFAETTIELSVNSLPLANTLNDLIGCDDNNDGISEYFDTSMVEANVLREQTGMVVSYYNTDGNKLPELPNPYTNTTPNQESIIVRVTDASTMCFAETNLLFITSERPQINDVDDIFACGDDAGFALFDTSLVTTQLIGNQTGLAVSYYDINGNSLSNFTTTAFRNQTPFQQQILARVENELNASCNSETTLNLIVNTPPEIDLEELYFLCDLEPSLALDIDPDFDSFLWNYEDGTQISTTEEAIISLEGDYTLIVNKLINGINCQKTFSFSLIRSDLPQIEKVEFRDLSNQNFIEIITVVDGDFEFSIDGETYFDDNVFKNVLGGFYTVYVRDKKGCGEDSAEVTLVDFPKFFTPNADNANDYWQIFGTESYPSALIYIYDRFGKIVAQISASDKGWDGNYNGSRMPSSDYWFKVDLGNGRNFMSHFSLKR